MNNPSVHVGIIGWTDQHDRCRLIASSLINDVQQVSIVYSDKSGDVQKGAGNWYQVDDSWFYGRKFKFLLSKCESDVLIVIQADAKCTDWVELVRRCRKRFAESNTGIWVPFIEGTPFKPAMTTIWSEGDKQFVSMVDGITWALSRPVQQRLGTLDYTQNNLGWGIELFATAFSYCHQYEVLRDPLIEVFHEQGAGYAKEQACIQMQAFLTQMTPEEKRVYHRLGRYHRIMAFCRIKFAKQPVIGDVSAWLLARLYKRILGS